MATITAAAGSTNWTTAAFGAQAATTAADDVIIPTGASVTISSANTVLCRSLSVTGTGTIIFAATTSVVSIGTTTAGSGNVALSIASTATVTLTAVGTINLISTSATQQTINTGGKTIPNLTINGAGSSYLMAAALTSSGTITVSAGTFNTGSYAITCSILSTSGSTARTLTLGSSTITVSSSSTPIVATGSNLTITSNTAGFITNGVNPRVNVTVNMNGSSLTYTGGGAATIASGGTWNNVTVTGTASLTDGLGLEGTLTVTGTFTATGNSAVNRVIIQSNTLGTSRTLTAAAVSLVNVDFMDITGAGAASWSGTTIGDRQGNSGITFTTPATQTFGGSSGNWNDATKWTSRVPLPQDDVVINGSSGNITGTGVLCMGKSIDFTGYSGTITLSTKSNDYLIFGSLTLASGMSYGTNPATFNITFSGRSSHTITSNGKALFPAGSNATMKINCASGTYTLQDSLDYKTPSTTSNVNVTSGTFNANGYNVSTGRFLSSGTATRAVTLGTNVYLYGTTSVSLITMTTTGLTLSASSTTFTVVNASASVRSLDLGGNTIGTFNYTVANSNAGLTITSSGTINNFNIGSGRLLTVAAGQTLTTYSATLTGTANGYIYMPGDNYGASAPDSAALSITGDMDFRQRMSFDSFSPGGSMRIAAKYNSTGSQQSWRLYITAAGALVLDLSTTGADSSVATASITMTAAGLLANTNYWIRFTREKSTGSVKFYYASDSVSMPSVWNQIGTTRTATTSNLFDSTSALTIGGESSVTNPSPGRYYRTQLRNNILDDGTGIQFDADFTSKTVGADSFTESSSNAATVAMNGLSVYGDGRLQIVSGTPGSKAYISKPSGGPITGVNYLKIQDIVMIQPLSFYAGTNSIDVSGNGNISFANTTYKHVQSIATTAVSATSISATYSTATTPGSLLIAYIESAGTTGTITDPAGWSRGVVSSSGIIYYKVATGLETTVTYSQITARQLTISITEYTGFIGTPTLDVTDTNTGGSLVTSLSTTASTGPTNSYQPALALAFVGALSALAGLVSLTNGFKQDYTASNVGTFMHIAVKELTNASAVETTFTWTTARSNTFTGLAVFKDVISNNANFFQFF